MNIEEIKEYLNSKKDKIKNGAIKVASAALVTSMLAGGAMGLTGCQNNIIEYPKGQTITENPSTGEIQPSENFKKVVPDKPLEQYSGEEKVDMFVQNYAENNDFEYDRVQIGKSFDKENQEKVTSVMFINTDDWSFVNVKVPFEVFEECAKILNKNLSESDYTMSFNVNKDKEEYEKIADYIWKVANENHPLSAREEKKQLEELQKSVVGQLDRVMKQVVDKHTPFAKVNKVNSISFNKLFVGSDPYGNEMYKYYLNLIYLIDSEASGVNYKRFYVDDLNEERFEELKSKVSVEPDPEYGEYVVNRKKNLEEYKMLAEYVLGILKQKYPDCFEDTMER